MNDMRERLKDLLLKMDVYDECECKICGEEICCDECFAEKAADYLLANGVIVPLCNVGDMVYEIGYDLNSGWWEAHPLETEVKAICILTENDYYPLNRVGKDVFLTREEAERALKERE